MPTAVKHAIEVPGMVLEGVFVAPRELKQLTSRFWGVKGESRIYGGTSGRNIVLPVLIYDASRFSTAARLSSFIEKDLNQDAVQKRATLQVFSPASRPPYPDTSFEGAVELRAPMRDEAGSLGGGFFALVRLQYRQHT